MKKHFQLRNLQLMRSLIVLVLFIIFCSHLSFAQQYDDWLITGNKDLRHSNLQQALKDHNNQIEVLSLDPIVYLNGARLNKALGDDVASKLDLMISKRLNPLSLMIIDPELRSKYSAKKIYEYNYKNIGDTFVKSPSKYKHYKKLLDKLDLEHSQDSLITLVINKLNNLEIDDAESILKEIKIYDNNKAIIYDLYGKIYMKRNELTIAIKYFDMSIKANPSFSIAYHNRSICHKLLGSIDQAKKDLNSAIDLNDNISLFYFTQAKLNERIGDKNSALISYENAMNIDKNYNEVLINYSQLLKSLGQYDEGAKYLNLAIPTDNNSFENIFLEANLNFIYGEYEKAITGYDSYLQGYPNDSESIFNRGLSKLLLRNYEEGCKDLSISIHIDNNLEHRRLYNIFCNQSTKTTLKKSK